MAASLGNDVNMMPGFMVTGISCFGMPYGASGYGWIEIEKTKDEWNEVKKNRSTVKFIEVKNAT